MMRKFYPVIIMMAAIFLSFMATAQERYLDEMFSDYTMTADVVYGSNISVLTGIPVEQPLSLDVYEPAGDSLTDRPAFIVLHTGSFLPPLFNGQITGAKTDSVVVNICKRLTKLGYVAIAATYRLGWNPQADDQDVRTGTLMQAAYRGIQDTKTAVRYLRKSVAEDGNPYGIDGSKIALWGVGTGGYLSLGGSTLDSFPEVELDKFLNSQTLLPLVDSTVLGNIDGTIAAAAALPNHTGYSSQVSLCVNMGGAMGDISWIDGNGYEPPFVGFHSTGDVFAPYADGPVIVPTTNAFVVNVSGTKSIIDKANELGINDVLADIPAEMDPLADKMEAFKSVQVTLPLTLQMVNVGADNLYPFVLDQPQGSPWDWWDYATLQQVVAGTNAVLMTTFNADTLHANGLATNPDMSAEKGKIYLDTIFMVTIPRAYYAFGLQDTTSTSIQNVSLSEFEVSVSPNPYTDGFELTYTIEENSLVEINLVDMSGRVVQEVIKERQIAGDYNFVIPDIGIPSGVYSLHMKFGKKQGAQQIVKY